MANNNIVKLLLVEDDLEDENLIREALIEIEEHQQWGKWCTCNLIHVDQLADALDCIRAENFDAILLNISLPDAPSALDTLLEVQVCANGTPIIILADADDAPLAQRLIREGAQDVVVKTEMECTLLARAIRYAIERECRWAILESRILLDELTGAYDRRGFLHLAPLYLGLAGTNKLQATLILVDVGASRRSSDLELVLIRTTEVARVIFPGATLIGRLDQATLALLTIGLSESDAEMLARRLHLDISSAFPGVGEPRFGVTAAELSGSATVEELIKDCQRKLTIPAMLAD